MSSGRIRINITGLRTPIAISVSLLVRLEGGAVAVGLPPREHRLHAACVDVLRAHLDERRAAGLAGRARHVDGLAVEARGPTRRPQHGLLAFGGRDHRLPRVLDDAADEGNGRAEPEGAEPDTERQADQLAALDGRGLQGVGQVGRRGPALDLGGPAVVAVLDRDLLGDELLLEEHRADADRQDRESERQPVKRRGQAVDELARRTIGLVLPRPEQEHQ